MTNKVMSSRQIKQAEQRYFDTINTSSYLVGEVAKCLFKSVEYVFQKNICYDVASRVDSDFNLPNILIVCGKGNNGADGYALANILEEKCLPYKIYAVSEPKTAECIEYAGKILKERFIDLDNLRNGISQFFLVIDCIFGTGFRGECDENVSIINTLIDSSNLILSCDVPSGLDCDNGKASAATINANYTMAIGGLKYGHLLGDGKDYCGEIIIADVNLSTEDVEVHLYVGEDMEDLFAPRKNNTHKGNYGSLLIIADSKKYIGAGLLAYSAGVNILGECGMAVGTGYCKLSVPDNMLDSLAKHTVHCSLLPRGEIKFNNSSAIAIGMGMDNSESELLYDIVTTATCPILIDAEGLNILASNIDVLKNASSNIVLTPHVKEFSRLTKISVKDIIDNPIDIVKFYANKWGLTIVLKGTTSIISDGKRASLVSNGMPALAKGGSGDVLSGIIGGLLARGIEPYVAARAGVYIHAEAAKFALTDSNEYSLMPMDVAKAVSAIIKSKISATNYKIITSS